MKRKNLLNAIELTYVYLLVSEFSFSVCKTIKVNVYVFCENFHG